jgi:K+-sensing histidine kinase KdpD
MTNDPRLAPYQELLAISIDLASTLELETLLDNIIRAACELCSAEAASILLFDDIQKHLLFQSSTDKENQTRLRGIIVPTESLAGWVALHRQSLIVPDVHQDSRFFPAVEEETHFVSKSLVAVPLIAKDKLIGVLEVLNKNNGEFKEADLDTLNVLSAQAAIAIENSRLFQQSDLIKELVHELRTPLTSISLIANLMHHPVLPDEQRIHLAEMLIKETDRLNEMTTSFLDLARLESGRASLQRVPFDLISLMQECAALVQPKANQTGIQIKLDLPSGLPPLVGDRGMIRQVLSNLLSNAIKYNRPQGQITLNARVEDQFILTLSDTGYGISPEDQAHLFERFFRSSNTEKVASGTGLGLSICKKIIDAHQGRIEVSSILDSGTTFTIYLPK